MNDFTTDRHHEKNSKLKATAVVSLGLLLIATAFAFPLVGGGITGSNIAMAQQTEQQQNQTQSQNATTIANTTMTDMFRAQGVITGMIQQGGGGGGQQQNNTTAGGNQSSAPQANTTQATGSSSSTPFLLGGAWNINVESGNVTDFRANFTMVRTDATDHHNMLFTNFRTGNATDFVLDPAGKTTINGTADVAVNGTVVWPGIDTTLTIEKARVITIQPEEQEVRQHFQDQPIYGIVLRATGANGTTIVESTPAGGNQTQQEGGGILEQLTKPFQDLFG
ncbi:MAG: hypothetical protein HRF40_10370 [Nitrososphaera sp.]|jgi:hypothetical protein